MDPTGGRWALGRIENDTQTEVGVMYLQAKETSVIVSHSRGKKME